MQTSGRNALKSREEIIRNILMFTLMAAALAILAGCGGSSHPAAFTAPTPNNPAPGVQLVRINIAPATSLIGIAENRQLTAIGTYNDGSTADLTSQVTWSANSAPITTNLVTVTSKGMATGLAIGAAVVSASVGSTVGLIDLTVDTNGFTSSTIGVLSVPYKATIIDAAYVPQQTLIQGAYAVQEVNLDADQFTTSLPVPIALLASVPMPTGFVPNVAVGIQSSSQIAVISYTSPDVQIVDASNLSTDLTNNTVINTFSAPVSQSVTINGIKCMICAAVVNPTNNHLILSTAQGYYSLDPVAGTFTAIPFTPAPAPAQNLSLNPVATDPFILAPDPATGEVQILDLTTNAATTFSSSLTGVSAPDAVALNLLDGYGAIVDAQTNNLSFVNLATPATPQFLSVPSIGVCGSPSPSFLNMVAMGVSGAAQLSNAAQTLFISQTSGSCVGLAPLPPAGNPVQPASNPYGFGPMPATPDQKAFINGVDPNSIATFNSVVDRNNYGLLVDENQQWIAKINLGRALTYANIGVGNGNPPLPGGMAFSTAVLCALGPDCPPPLAVIYLPTPSTEVTLSVPSISFGTVAVGTLSALVPVTITNIGTAILNNSISVQGPNASDFSLTTNCVDTIQPRSGCAVNVAFTPSATGLRSATLVISAASPQTVALTGTGQ
jgi:hypothetical protein